MSGRQQITTMNGNKRSAPMPPRHYQNNDKNNSQLHEIIRFINESWNSVQKDLDHHHNQQYGGNSSANYRNSPSATYYIEKEPNPLLKDFEPFDLEAFCNKREVQNSARNTNS